MINGVHNIYWKASLGKYEGFTISNNDRFVENCYTIRARISLKLRRMDNILVHVNKKVWVNIFLFPFIAYLYYVMLPLYGTYKYIFKLSWICLIYNTEKPHNYNPVILSLSCYNLYKVQLLKALDGLVACYNEAKTIYFDNVVIASNDCVCWLC